MLPPLLLRTLIIHLPFLGAATYCSPLAAVLGLVEPDLFIRMALPVAPRFALPIYFITCAAVTVLCWIAGTARILTHRSSAPSRSGEDPASRAQGAKRLKFPYVLIDPRRRKRLIGDWTNPMLAKELRSKTFGQAPWVIRGMYATFTVSLILVGLMSQENASLHLDVLKLAMIGFQVLVVILIIPALLSGAVTQEVEQRQFDLLRQTLLYPHTYLFGKTASAWLLVVLLLVASVPMWWMMAYLESYQWISTLISLAVVGATLLLVTAISLTATMLSRTTAAATAIAYAVIAVLAFGTLTPLLMGETLSPQWRSAILAWNPFTAGLRAVSTELLQNETLLWKPYLSQTILTSACLFAIAWLLLWNKLRREG